jgi:cysteine desulfurase
MEGVVIEEMVRWTNRGNPSASYSSAQKARDMMDDFHRYIANGGGYEVIFCSGASEANATAVEAALRISAKPHIITSNVEHKSILLHLRASAEAGRCTLTEVPARPSGHVAAEDVRRAIREETVAIFVMSANNETGAINNTVAIAAAASGRYFHCDAVQSYGKYGAPSGVSSFAISFHKFGGPAGVGALVIAKKYCGLLPLIYGTQNNGMRGGTECLHGIAAAFLATKRNFTDRKQKNAHLAGLKEQFITLMSSAGVPITQYSQYLSARERIPKLEIVLLSTCADDYLCNTLLISIVLHDSKLRICNSATKKELEKQGIIVSVGSACNTASPTASHVLYAIGADQHIRAGALRISFGDANTSAEVVRFCKVFAQLLASIKTG